MWWILAIWSPSTAARCWSRPSASSILLRELSASQTTVHRACSCHVFWAARPAEGRVSSAPAPGPRGLHDIHQVVGFKRLCGRVQGGILFLLEKTEKERPQVTRQRGCLSTGKPAAGRKPKERPESQRPDLHLQARLPPRRENPNTCQRRRPKFSSTKKLPRETARKQELGCGPWPS